MFTGDEFRHTFTVPGEYRYVCVPHDMVGMVGTVIVEPADR
jgi:plastocyanin